MLGKNREDAAPVEALAGILRRTLVHNEQAMLCHFELKKGSKIPRHTHQPCQIGYVISGCVRFSSARQPDGFVTRAGDAYVFDPSEEHGAEAMEDSSLIEVFSPSRPEYR